MYRNLKLALNKFLDLFAKGSIQGMQIVAQGGGVYI